MSTLTIVREDSGGARGRYVARLPGVKAEAEHVFTRRGKDLVSADHTGVPEAIGGRGIGKALVGALVADARAEGFRIEPRCDFARAQLARRPEWADVLATHSGESPPISR